MARLNHHTIRRHARRIGTHAARTTPLAAPAVITIALLLAMSMPTQALADTPAEIRAQLTSAKSKRDALYDQAEKASEALNDAQAKLDETNASIEKTQRDIDAKSAETSNAKAQLTETLRHGYKDDSTTGIISVLANASSISDFTQSLTAALKVTNDTNGKIATVQEQQKELQSSLDELSSLQAQQQEQVAQCQSSKEELDAKANKASSYVSSLSSDLKKAIADEDAREQAQRTQTATTITQQNVDASSLDGWRQKVLSVAYSEVGGIYVYGGNAFRATDCSGLVMQCYAAAGVSLPHSADADGARYCNKPISKAEPGDIVWHPGHVGIYIGNGQTIEAFNPGSGIGYGNVSRFYRCGSPLG